MNRVPERSKECEALSDDLMEFALGTLTGRGRATVLEHLESCAACTAESETLAEVADALLWLAPEAEPGLGFETRVIERLRGSDAQRRMARRRRVSVYAVAAMLVAVLGVGVGAVAMSHGAVNTPSATPRPATGRLMSDGRVLGRGDDFVRRSSWMVMDVDTGKVSGLVWCEVTFADGHRETVGKFDITHGYGSWVAADEGVRERRSIRDHRGCGRRGPRPATFAT